MFILYIILPFFLFPFSYIFLVKENINLLITIILYLIIIVYIGRLEVTALVKL